MKLSVPKEALVIPCKDEGPEFVIILKLFISYLKRKAKMKDTGKFLPGHGGLLDRIDGIYFALPFGWLILNL